MKHRWIAAPLLAAALSLGACAPQQGTDGSAEPTAEATPAATPTAEPTTSPSVEATESAAPTPDSYEY